MGTFKLVPDFGTRTSFIATTPSPNFGLAGSLLSFCHTLCTMRHLYPLLSHTSLDSLLLLCHFVPLNLQSTVDVFSEASEIALCL